MVSANFDFDDDNGEGEAPKWLEWSAIVWYGVMGGALLAVLFGLTR